MYYTFTIWEGGVMYIMDKQQKEDFCQQPTAAMLMTETMVHRTYFDAKDYAQGYIKDNNENNVEQLELVDRTTRRRR